MHCNFRGGTDLQSNSIAYKGFCKISKNSHECKICLLFTFVKIVLILFKEEFYSLSTTKEILLLETDICVI